MRLAAQWDDLAAGLAPDWHEVAAEVVLEDAGDLDRAMVLLGPLQPFRAGDGRVSLRASRDGSGLTADALRRGLDRLDRERLHGNVSLDVVGSRPAGQTAAGKPTLVASWEAAIAGLPADWSDLLGEIELDSSDYLEPGAVNLVPLNPRRVGTRVAFRFRSASRRGYGASAGMVRRCLERCDSAGMTGRVSVLRVLCDTHPVGTQGPVWHIDGEMV